MHTYIYMHICMYTYIFLYVHIYVTFYAKILRHPVDFALGKQRFWVSLIKSHHWYTSSVTVRVWLRAFQMEGVCVCVCVTIGWPAMQTNQKYRVKFVQTASSKTSNTSSLTVSKEDTVHVLLIAIKFLPTGSPSGRGLLFLRAQIGVSRSFLIFESYLGVFSVITWPIVFHNSLIPYHVNNI